ncbi:LOW QUALITY PROTEIN: lipoxygenase homology domain-containing protein 1 [Pluvialis apricaria]
MEKSVRKLDNDKDNFEKGAEDKFTLNAPNLGKLRKINIRHNNKGGSETYTHHLEQVLGATWSCIAHTCNWRLFCIDKKTADESPWSLWVWTSDIKNAGTDATIFFQIGDEGKADEMKLDNSSDNFETGQTDKFMIELPDLGAFCKRQIWYKKRNPFAGWHLNKADEFFVEAVTLKQVRRVRIRHDGKGGSSGWYLAKAKEEGQPESEAVEFPYYRWLDKNEDDGQTVRELVPTGESPMLKNVSYHISVKMGDIPGASSGSKVFIKLYGEKADSSKEPLLVSDNDLGNYFEHGRVDEFTLDTMDIGKINRILIGQDNMGLRSGWFLVSVQITVPVQRRQYMFPCNRWLDEDEADGRVEVEVYPSEIVPIEKLINYEVSVVTGGVQAAGTNAKVFMQIYGETGKTELFILENRSSNFEWGATDIFKGYMPLTLVVIAHLNPWSLFMEDGVLRIHNSESLVLRFHTYKISMFTGAGTDGNVFLNIYGDLGDTGERKLSKSEVNFNKFERGQEDMFTIQAADLGILYKIKIRHDNSMFMIPYHITATTGTEFDSSTDSVFIIIMGPQKVQTERLWLDLPKGKGEFADGSVEKFSVCSLDVVEIKNVEASCHSCVTSCSPGWTILELGGGGPVGHDDATPESCLEELTIVMPTKGIMLCKCWLAKDKGDGLTSRILKNLDADCVNVGLKILYEVTVVTGDIERGSTDTSIFMTVFGSNGNTEEIQLEKNGDRFERGQEDSFIMEIADITPLRKMRIWMDGKGTRPHWFLERIILKNLTNQEVATFTYGEWLSKLKNAKGSLVCEMPAVINDKQMMEDTTYSTLQVKTSDVGGASTNANVSLILFGENGDSRTLALKESNKSNKFERNQMDKFNFSDMLSLGDLCNVWLCHDNKGIAPGWHLEYIDVTNSAMDKTFCFQCDRWLAKGEDDGQLIRELACANNDILELKEWTTYEIVTVTSDREDAETKENIWIILEGKMGHLKEFLMKNSSKKRRFERGATDTFRFSSKNVGDIAAICVGHCPKDGKKSSTKADVFWHVQEIILMEMELCNKYYFRCNVKIPLCYKGQDYKVFECAKVTKSFASKTQSLVQYETIVVTGFEKGVGTDANMFITIFGLNGDSGKRVLKRKFRNPFERGKTNRFYLEMLDMGELKKVWLEHNSSMAPGWLVEQLEITNSAPGVTTIFPCGWLDEKWGDGLIWRELFPRY